ncbi:hypothetical protein GCM10009117_05420 [Gangjinia marincola]|uniref:HTH tetR-type domain-containing protein n=1 Tax=Gangjinia marincola TaxID=578463 RepID=A0ABN1ME55_9FLAO
MKKKIRKKEILKTAAGLFKEKGYNAVTMRDLAKEMDIKAASLYNHIDSKQQILSELILEVAQRFTEGMDKIDCKENPALEKLEEVIEFHIDITLSYTDVLASLNNDWMHLENQELEDYLMMRQRYEDNFKTIIKKGIEEGSIQHYNEEIMLFSILSTLRTLYLWYPKKEKIKAEILKEQMVDTLLYGLVRRNLT